MGHGDREGWRDGWPRQLLGHGCVMCELIKAPDSSWAIQVHAGTYVRAYLPRTGSITGYTVAVWNGRHVAEPTELETAEADGYWREVLRIGRAVAQTFEHAKMNYLTLGNSVPHLHTHIVPRPLLDPAPHRPLPWSYLDEGQQDEDHVVTAAIELQSAIIAAAGP